MNEKTKSLLRGVILGVILSAVLYGLGYYVRYGIIPILNDSVVSGSSAWKAAAIEQLIEEKYMGDEVEKENLADGMYAGMVASLGDKYSGYYSASQYEELLKATEGRYQGIGLSMVRNQETGEITVQEVYDGSPAETAGIQEGDQMYKMDGTLLQDMELGEISEYLQNQEQVELTLIREGEAEPVQVTVSAGQVEVPVVTSRMLDQHIGYLKIDEFTEGTSHQFAEAYEKLQKEGLEALVIDLRDNPGGLLDAVCDTLEQILPEGLIVYTEDKDGNRTEHMGSGETPIAVPLAVLVNENTASAAEIFSGAVKDYQVGTLVGTVTYGKGIVQQTYQLPDGSAVKLTVAKYYTPSGVNIQGTGIQPDIPVEWPEDQEPLESDFDYEEIDQAQWLARDVQMEKAVETLRNNMVQ